MKTDQQIAKEYGLLVPGGDNSQVLAAIAAARAEGKVEEASIGSTLENFYCKQAVARAKAEQRAEDVQLLGNATREQTEGFAADFGDCWRAGEWLEAQR